MSKAKKLVTLPNLDTIVSAGTINNRGEMIPYSGEGNPSSFYFDGSLYKIASRFYDTISGESKVLGPLFGCSVDGLTCAVTISGEMSIPAVPPEYKAPDEQSLVFDFRFARYSVGDWAINKETETEHYAYKDSSSKTLGGNKEPITSSWTRSYFIRWYYTVSTTRCGLIDPEAHPDLPKYYDILPQDKKCKVSLTLEIPAIPFDIESDFYGFPQYTERSNPSPYVGFIWTMDSNFWRFPYISQSGIAPEYDGEFWTMDGNFYGFPYIKNSGVAPPYQRGFSDLYLGAKNVKNLHLGRMPVKRVYRGKELVFEKG